MSTFYLLPHRSVLGDFLADSMTALLPGMDWSVADRRRLAESLTENVARRQDVFLVSREDLPPGELPETGLVDGFGAEPGDEVIEVRFAARPGEVVSRRWKVA